MKTKPVKLTPPEKLTDLELTVADSLAAMFKDPEISTPRGLLIHNTCKANGVDHHKIARHLGSRNKKW